MIQSEIKPATFQLLGHYLNQLCQGVPHLIFSFFLNKPNSSTGRKDYRGEVQRTPGLRLPQPDNSVLAEHIISTDHFIDFSDT
jgi:hypothetical protein